MLNLPSQSCGTAPIDQELFQVCLVPSAYSLVLTGPTDLQSAIIRYPYYLVVRTLSLRLPHISGRPPKATMRNEWKYVVKVGPAATPWRVQRILTLCDTQQGTLTDRRRQSAFSQKTSCLKYFVSIKRITTNLSLSGNGIYLCKSVEDGDKSFSHHHSASTCELFVHP